MTKEYQQKGSKVGFWAAAVCAMVFNWNSAAALPVTDLTGVSVSGCWDFFNTCNSSSNEYLTDTAVIGAGEEFTTGNRNASFPWWQDADFDADTLTVEYFFTSTSMANSNQWFELDLASIGKKLLSVTLRPGGNLPVSSFNFTDERIEVFVSSQSVNNESRVAIFDIVTAPIITTVAEPGMPLLLAAGFLGLMAVRLRSRR